MQLIMRRAYEIDINEIGKYYTITEDGTVYSHVRKRWLKPQQNSIGYIHYCLSFGVPRAMWIFAHTLVALKYIGRPPEDGYEIDHKDQNICNNHYSNLQWVTHNYNVFKAYKHGRIPYWSGKRREVPVTLETRMKMANAKKKRVVYALGGVETVYESINEAMAGIGGCAKSISRHIKSGKPFRGGILSFADDSLS